MKNLGIIIAVLLVVVIGAALVMGGNEGATGVVDETNGDEQAENNSDLQNALVADTWVWQETRTADDEVALEPTEAGAFTLDFIDGSTVGAATDCNSWSGVYEADGVNAINVDLNISTRMFCEGSQEQEYVDMVNSAIGFGYDEEGNLVLTLEDGGVAYFVAAEALENDATESEDETSSSEESVPSEDEL